MDHILDTNKNQEFPTLCLAPYECILVENGAAQCLEIASENMSFCERFCILAVDSFS